MARAVVIAISFFGMVALATRTTRASSDDANAAQAVLERVRSDPALADDPHEIDALAREAEAFPSGRLRTEARMIVAEAWRGRMHRPNDAIAELRKLEGDPSTDPITARLAERELVDALVLDGKIGEAFEEARGSAARLDPRFVTHVQRLARRKTWTVAAVAELAVYFALALLAFMHAHRARLLENVVRSVRQLIPLAVGFAAYVAIVGGVLASQYEAGNARPFLVLGVAVVPIVLVARAWSAAGSASPSARLGRAALCTTSVLAAGFLVLSALRADYLDGFGL